MTPHQTCSPNSPPSSLFRQPRPRRARSPLETQRIRRQNRRWEWLDRNPSYLSSLEHEFADPILYDALVRKFQSASERQGEAKSKGYGRVLEGDLLRGEAKLARMADEHKTAGHGQDEPHDTTLLPPAPGASPVVPSSSATETQEEALEALELEPPRDREQALGRWHDFLKNRFVRGEDDDFDYSVVDNDDQFDAMEGRDREEEWFDDEEPSWACDESGEDRAGKPERMLQGETGIQDF